MNIIHNAGSHSTVSPFIDVSCKTVISLVAWKSIVKVIPAIDRHGEKVLLALSMSEGGNSLFSKTSTCAPLKYPSLLSCNTS